MYLSVKLLTYVYSLFQPWNVTVTVVVFYTGRALEIDLAGLAGPGKIGDGPGRARAVEIAARAHL